ncbi:hypothetical protein DPEC_G00311890 [Dallia pectoralis]|uniref:Uncharacterized protein n=1 Tax=Dallia pectoralis TaxID=75939 RepID=A0ACC2FBI6_DALPE|nr:hypothetical protein DPEC_G00311890 [Dallia pectoralis]
MVIEVRSSSLGLVPGRVPKKVKGEPTGADLPGSSSLPVRSVSRRGQEEPRSSHCYSSLSPGPSIPGLVRRTEKTGRGRGQATVTPAVFSVHKRGQKSSTKKEAIEK